MTEKKKKKKKKKKKNPLTRCLKMYYQESERIKNFVRMRKVYKTRTHVWMRLLFWPKNIHRDAQRI